MAFDDANLKKLLSCSCCFIFLTSVILFAVSFDKLEPYEIGIKQNNYKLTLDEEHGAYSNGRYFIGVGSHFVKFPSHLIAAEFSGSAALRAWSKEGQLIVIELGFYYRLQRDNIVSLYKKYNHDYHARMIQIATRSIKQVTIMYDATDFFEDRTNIGNHMSRELRARMIEEDMIMELFALRAIDIPNLFEQKVVDKVVKLQEKKTALHKKDTASARANIEVKRGEGRATVNEAISKASADATRIIEQAKATGFQMVTEQQAASYSQLMDALGLDSDDLNRFRYAQMFDRVDSPDRQVSVGLGFGSASLSVPSSTPSI